MTKIPLSVTFNYIKHWGLPELFREFAQGALDEPEGFIQFDPEIGSIYISNSGKLERKHLLYGGTTKADVDTKRGMHGEGMKNAMLVALRDKISLKICSGADLWEPTYEYSDLYREECLHITIKENFLQNPSSKVVVEIQNLTLEEMLLCAENYLDHKHAMEAVFGTLAEGYAFKAKGTPRLYVGGLFVSDMPKSWWESKNYAYSYNLPPTKVKLDRDRNMVDTYTLQGIIADLLIKSGKADIITELTETSALDVEGCSGMFNSGQAKELAKEVATSCLENFYEEHGEDAIPISNSVSALSRKKQQVEDLGLKPIVVRESVYDIYSQGEIKNRETVKFTEFNLETFLEELLETGDIPMGCAAYDKIEYELDIIRASK